MSNPARIASLATLLSKLRGTWRGARTRWTGLLLCASTAIVAATIGRTAGLQSHGVGALTIAIVLGMVIGNAAYRRVPGLAARCNAGVAYSQQTLLRAGIIFYGLRLTVQDVGTFGISGALIDAAMLISTFLLATFAGTRWLGMDRKSAMLIGAGSAICGAAAIMAAESVVRARAEEVTVAVATVVIFGTVSIFLYPALFRMNEQWHFLAGGDGAFGIYVGSTVHEVAQVVATARSIGAQATDTAVIAKLVRVLMLAPFLVGLSAWLRLDRARAEDRPRGAKALGQGYRSVPWFALGFIALVIVNSLGVLPVPARETALTIDNLALAMAMSALGISTRLSTLRQAGARPLLLALIAFCWLVLAGAAVNRWVPQLVACL